MLYTVDWAENKTLKNGAKIVKATLKDENGQLTNDVTFWATEWNTVEITPGTKVEANVVTKSNGQYTNVTAYKPKPSTPSFGGSFRGGGAARSEQIKEAQDRKEMSIAYFSSLNAAIALLGHDVAFLKESDESKQEAIRLWRDFFYKEWANFDKEKEAGDLPF